MAGDLQPQCWLCGLESVWLCTIHLKCVESATLANVCKWLLSYQGTTCETFERFPDQVFEVSQTCKHADLMSLTP